MRPNQALQQTGHATQVSQTPTPLPREPAAELGRSAAEAEGVRGYYTVWFMDITGCAVGISDISWWVTVSAESEAAALEQGLAEARALNREFGLPPHGIRVSEDELRRLACVQPMRYA